MKTCVVAIALLLRLLLVVAREGVVAAAPVLMQMRQTGISHQVHRVDVDVDEEVDAAAGVANSTNSSAELEAEVRRMSDLLEATHRSIAEIQGSLDECSANPGCHCRASPATPSPAPHGPRTGLCACFGDPHFMTFDGAHTTLVGDLTMWLVRSSDVWIQGLSEGANGELIGFAVGGPFLQGHSFALYNATDGGPLRAVLDGSAVLAQPGDDLSVPGVVEGFRRNSWNASLHNSNILAMRTLVNFDIGTWRSRFLDDPEGGLWLFRFGGGEVEITATGVDFMSAVIAMAPRAGGQSGYCGNYNDDPSDEAEAVAPSWDRPVGPDLDGVEDADNLFLQNNLGDVLSLFAQAHGRVGGRGRRQQQPDNIQEAVESFNNCSHELRLQAGQACSHVLELRMRWDCVFDVCRTGDLSAANGTMAATVLEDEVSAMGVPRLMGLGECLDGEGRRFAAFPTLEVDSSEACNQLLRALALTQGVLGAQLQHGGTCEILMEPGQDPTQALVPGGWAPAGGRAVVGGNGLVSGVTEDATWNCWKLN